MKTKSKESHNLDFLRSVAVLSVFGSHLRHFVTGIYGIFEWRLGQLGVLMFFVHTSLVLMMSLERSGLVGFRMFASFYIRRLFRIYPLSICCVLLVYFTRYRPELGVDFHQWTIKELAANLSLTQNLFYFDDMLRVLWSLPLEVQMYLFLPFLFLLARTTRIRNLLLLWAGCVALGLAQIHLTGRLNVIGYAPCFVPGVIAWRLITERRHQLSGLLWPVALAMVSCVWFAASREFDMYFRWAFCLLLGLAIPFFYEIPNKWLGAACKTIAKYSYGIYLTHLFTMSISFVIIRNPVLQWSAFVALAILLPIIAYHLIEDPGIKLGRWIAARLSEPFTTECRPWPKLAASYSRTIFGDAKLFSALRVSTITLLCSTTDA